MGSPSFWSLSENVISSFYYPGIRASFLRSFHLTLYSCFILFNSSFHFSFDNIKVVYQTWTACIKAEFLSYSSPNRICFHHINTTEWLKEQTATSNLHRSLSIYGVAFFGFYKIQKSVAHFSVIQG